jgi:hypothetical protein
MDSLTFCTHIFNKGHLDPMLCIIVLSSQYLDIPSLEDDTVSSKCQDSITHSNGIVSQKEEISTSLPRPQHTYQKLLSGFLE